ncbi:hypothetical protein JHK85_031434 [Glycine max]|nr:hypothetical protein JHK85_031434 [Glycine max]
MKFLKIFISKPFKLRTFNSLSHSQTPPFSIPTTLLLSIESSQWHFIEQVAPHLTPSLLSSTLTTLRRNPQLVLHLLSHLHNHPLSLVVCVLYRLPSPKPSINLLQRLILSSTATNRTIFNELALARDRVDVKTTLIFDLLVRPTVNSRSPMRPWSMAWVLYAEVFRINIRSNVGMQREPLGFLMKWEGKVEEARLLLDEMKRRGIKPDLISYNTLISGYSKRGDMKDAFGVRDEMMTTGFDPTILTYDALIQGLCKNREGEHAEELLKEMVSKGIPPDDSTYLSIIEAMEAVDDLEENDDK